MDDDAVAGMKRAEPGEEVGAGADVALVGGGRAAAGGDERQPRRQG
ncbi:MAG TPA: hypothetical protein VGF21_12965 [Thermoleophilaceae bacterium]